MLGIVRPAMRSSRLLLIGAFLLLITAAVMYGLRADAPPLAVPVWYDFEPQRGIWFLTGSRSAKADLIRRAGRLTL